MREILLTSSVLILLLTFLRHVLHGKIPLRAQYALWLLVALRLLLPASLPASPVSVLNLTREHSAEMTAPVSAMHPSLPETMENHPVPFQPYSPDTVTLSDDDLLESADRPIHWERVLRTLWLCGMAVMGIWFLVVNVRFRVTAKKGAKKLEPSFPLPVYLSENVPSPCLMGLFRPVVYVTPDCETDPEKLRYVLAHELTHQRHGDLFWSLLRACCLCIYWFDPLVWWAASLSRRDCELACDEGTIAALGEEARFAYGKTLVDMVSARVVPGRLLCTSTTMTDRKSGIMERVQLIAKQPSVTVTAVGLTICIAAIATACTFTGAETNSVNRVLTEEEIAQVNEAFRSLEVDEKRNVVNVNPVNGFFSSYYEDVTELNFAEFLRYHPSETLVGDADTAEFAALTALPDFFRRENPPASPKDLGVPTHRLLRASVDETLKKYAGITTDDLKSTDGVLYLPEYDAWYNFTSDFGPGIFQCVGGQIEGNTAVLWSGIHASNHSYDELTLVQKGQSWYIHSFQQKEASSERAAGTAEEILDRLAEQTLSWNLYVFGDSMETTDQGVMSDSEQSRFLQRLRDSYTWEYQGTGPVQFAGDEAFTLTLTSADLSIWMNFYSNSDLVTINGGTGKPYGTYHLLDREDLGDIGSYALSTFYIDCPLGKNENEKPVIKEVTALVEALTDGGLPTISLEPSDQGGGGDVPLPGEDLKRLPKAFRWRDADSLIQEKPHGTSVTIRAARENTFLQVWEGSYFVSVWSVEPNSTKNRWLLAVPSRFETWDMTTNVYGYLRGMYDNAELAFLRETAPIPDDGQDQMEIVQAWVDDYERARLKCSPGSSQRNIWFEASVELLPDQPETWFPAETQHKKHFAFSYSVVFVPESETALQHQMAGNTVEYTDEERKWLHINAPDGAYVYWRRGAMVLTDAGWVCEQLGTG